MTTPRHSHRRLRHRMMHAGGVLAVTCAAALLVIQVSAAITRVHGLLESDSTGAVDDPPAAAAPHTLRAAPGDAGATRSGPGTDLPATALPATVASLPQSTGIAEPTLVLDHHGTVYVTGPGALLDHYTAQRSQSPLWRSHDGGATFDGPVATETGGVAGTGLGGGGSDLVVDDRDTLYLASLWSGSTSMSYSSDGGTTWIGLPYSTPTPVHDRPWLAYVPRGPDVLSFTGASAVDSLSMAWNGPGGIHVGRAALRGAAQDATTAAPASLVFAQDVLAVPEEPETNAGAVDGTAVRECVCPAGPIVSDAAGVLWFAYAAQRGVGVAMSSTQGLTWFYETVPGSGVVGDPLSVANGFPVVRLDSRGNAYVVWSQYDTTSSHYQVYYSYELGSSSCGASSPLTPAPCFHTPIRVPTPRTALFAAMDVIAPAVVDIAYYGTDDYDGNPQSAPAGTRWNLYLAQSADALSAGDFATRTALRDVHHGSICVAGMLGCQSGVGGGTADSTLGGFLSLRVDSSSHALIATQTDGGRGIAVVHQTGDPLFAPTAARQLLIAQQRMRPSVPPVDAAGGTQPAAPIIAASPAQPIRRPTVDEDRPRRSPAPDIAPPDDPFALSADLPDHLPQAAHLGGGVPSEGGGGSVGAAAFAGAVLILVLGAVAAITRGRT